MIRVGDYVRITCNVKSSGWETGDIGRVTAFGKRERASIFKMIYVKILKNSASSLWYQWEVKKISKREAFIEAL